MRSSSNVTISGSSYLQFTFFCCRFTASKDAAHAMRLAIRLQFREVYECWENVPQDQWFATFSVRI